MGMTLEEKVDLALRFTMRLAQQANALAPWEKWMVLEDISEKDIERVYDEVGKVARRYYEKQDRVAWSEVESAIRKCGYSTSQARTMFAILYGTDGHEDFYESVENQPLEVQEYLKEVKGYFNRKR